MKRYFCDDKFHEHPPEKWTALPDLILPRANYCELNRLFRDAQVPAVLAEALVALPPKIPRVYAATHRFRLTASVEAYLRSITYAGFYNEPFENLAFYQDDMLLLGTISHEDYVVLLLDETERRTLNDQGYDFWCEWTLE